MSSATRSTDDPVRLDTGAPMIQTTGLRKSFTVDPDNRSITIDNQHGAVWIGGNRRLCPS